MQQEQTKKMLRSGAIGAGASVVLFGDLLVHHAFIGLGLAAAAAYGSLRAVYQAGKVNR